MAVEFGERVLERGLKGADVEELQIRLAGFRGTVPDGDFGPGTEMQVLEFQRLYMGMATPVGFADGDTLRATDRFAKDFPLPFRKLKCPCGVCGGFGQGRFRGRHLGDVRNEKHLRYEYPGIHRMLLWAVRAVFFLCPEYDMVISSGYRCGVENTQHDPVRTSTNHHGKAVDIDVMPRANESRKDETEWCSRIRGRLVEVSHAQLGWGGRNRKSMKPSRMAPTWVHYDVRAYEKKYLAGRFFCTSATELNAKRPINV